MKKTLLVLLFACPVFAAEQPNKQTPKPMLSKETIDTAVIAGGLILSHKPIRDVAISTIIVASTSVPSFVPLAIAGGIAYRIMTSDQNQKK